MDWYPARSGDISKVESIFNWEQIAEVQESLMPINNSFLLNPILLKPIHPIQGKA